MRILKNHVGGWGILDIFTFEPNSLVNVWQMMGLKYLTVGMGGYIYT